VKIDVHPEGRHHPPAPAVVSDAVLIHSSILDGERFAELYDRHLPFVRRFVARRLGPESADDVVADAFLAAFRVRGRYDLSYPDARPWLLGIATREISRRRRQERARYRLLASAPVDSPVDGPAEAVAAAVSAESLRRPLARALARLKPADRDVLLLVAWGDLSYQEVAEALEIPVGTVRSRLHRARRIVRAALGDLNPLLPAEEA
jgi:RNA polymerase sigma-70 factor (ECF subfamily)